MSASTQIDIAAAVEQAEANVALIKRFFRLLEEKNISEWRTLWAEDGIYQIPYDDEDASYDVPFEREGTVATILGADAIATLFSVIPTYVRTARLFDITISQTLDPATVYVEFALEFLIDRTGVLYKNLGIGRMEIEDGKVRLFREYLDNDQRKKGWAGVFWNDEVAPSGDFFAIDVLRPKDGKAAELKAALLKVAAAEAAAGTDRGLLRFDVLENADSGDAVAFVEEWADRKAFEAFHANHRPPELIEFLETHADSLLDHPVSDAVSFWRRTSSA